jgi:hypothetical protein
VQFNQHEFTNGTGFSFCPEEIYDMRVFDKPELDQAGTQILHPGSRALFRHWESIRAERACPKRDDFDLRQIVEIVPDLMIVEKNMINSGWQYRLAGTRLCELFQTEMTGKDALAGWDAFERDVVSKSLEITLTRLQPSLVRMRFITERRAIIAAEMIALPIHSSENGAVQIIGGIFPFVDRNRDLIDKPVRRELVSSRMIWTEHEPGDALLDQAGRKASAFLRVIQGGLK